MAKDKPNSPDLNFLSLLQSFRKGELLAESDLALSELVAAIRATGGSGKIALELPVKMNKAGQLEIQPRLKVEKPRRALPAGIFYATERDGLSRRDPNQSDIEDITGWRSDTH